MNCVRQCIFKTKKAGKYPKNVPDCLRLCSPYAFQGLAPHGPLSTAGGKPGTPSGAYVPGSVSHGGGAGVGMGGGAGFLDPVGIGNLLGGGGGGSGPLGGGPAPPTSAGFHRFAKSRTMAGGGSGGDMRDPLPNGKFPEMPPRQNPPRDMRATGPEPFGPERAEMYRRSREIVNSNGGIPGGLRVTGVLATPGAVEGQMAPAPTGCIPFPGKPCKPTSSLTPGIAPFTAGVPLANANSGMEGYNVMTGVPGVPSGAPAVPGLVPNTPGLAWEVYKASLNGGGAQASVQAGLPGGVQGGGGAPSMPPPILSPPPGPDGTNDPHVHLGQAALMHANLGHFHGYGQLPSAFNLGSPQSADTAHMKCVQDCNKKNKSPAKLPDCLKTCAPYAHAGFGSPYQVRTHSSLISPYGNAGTVQDAEKGHVECAAHCIKKKAKLKTPKEMENCLRACAPYIYAAYGPHSETTPPQLGWLPHMGTRAPPSLFSPHGNFPANNAGRFSPPPPPAGGPPPISPPVPTNAPGAVGGVYPLQGIGPLPGGTPLTPGAGGPGSQGGQGMPRFRGRMMPLFGKASSGKHVEDMRSRSSSSSTRSGSGTIDGQTHSAATGATGSAGGNDGGNHRNDGRGGLTIDQMLASVHSKFPSMHRHALVDEVGAIRTSEDPRDTPGGPLPQGWIAVSTPTNERYFWNTATNATR